MPTLSAAEEARRIRYAAATTAQPISAVTAAEATAELADADDEQLQAVARPLFMPLRPPAPKDGGGGR